MILNLCMSNVKICRHILKQMLIFLFSGSNICFVKILGCGKNYRIFKYITSFVVLVINENSRISNQLPLDFEAIVNDLLCPADGARP